METSLGLDNKAKQLCLHFKKRIEHSSDTVLKLRGTLNTVTAAADVTSTLNKFFRLGAAPSPQPGEIYQPDTRIRLGLGAKASTGTDDIFFSVNAKKKVVVQKQQDVLRSRVVLRSYTQLAVGAHYDLNVRTERWGGEATAALSHAMFRFTEEQDVRVTAGVRVPLLQSGAGDPQPFLRLQENAWSLHADAKGGWRVTYDL